MSNSRDVTPRGLLKSQHQRDRHKPSQMQQAIRSAEKEKEIRDIRTEIQRIEDRLVDLKACEDVDPDLIVRWNQSWQYHQEMLTRTQHSLVA